MTDQALTTATGTTNQRCPLRTHMGLESERQLSRFEDFVAALEADARGHALDVWREFEARLRRRWVQEELLLLPTFAKAHPVEAQALKRDHEQLRRALRRLSARLQLHVLRAEDARQFSRLLRRHHHAKDALYAWTEAQLTASARQQLVHLLRAPVAASDESVAFESGSFESCK